GENQGLEKSVRVGVVKPQTNDEPEVWNQERDWRHGLHADDDDVQRPLEWELEPRERVSSLNGHDQRENGDRQCDNVAIDKETHLDRVAENGPVGVEREVLSDDPRRQLEDLRVGLEGAGPHPEDGERREQGSRQQG